MTCDKCGHEFNHLVGAIISGKYGQYCNKCLKSLQRPHSAGAASYHRARDREDNAKDLIQPWDAKGNPNTDFIRNYPEESKDMFTPKELADHG